MDNIILIGMPASGKSTVGVVLAKRLGYEFIDTDLLIQKQEQALLREIIAEKGEDGFLVIEDQVNADLEAERSVIAPGGSVVYCENAMKHYKEIGTVVYLQTSYQTIKERIGNSIIAILPADPIIKDEDLFTKTLEEAVEVTSKTKKTVIIGIKPNRAETGYGYIKLTDNIKDNEFKVERFVEKPNLENAKKFLDDGNYLWNSGMFIWDIESVLKAVKSLMPDTYNKVIEAFNNIRDKEKLHLAKEIFAKIEKISFDMGIMEKLKDIICIKAEFFWDDLGAFSALGRIYKKDKDNNVIIGNAYIKESKNNIIINDDKDFITVDGINNLTIVKSNGALLIYSDNQDSKIKEILKKIKEKEELKDNRKFL